MGERRLVSSLLQKKEVSVSAILITTILFFYSIQQKFLSATNVDVIAKITPELGIPALGVTMLMIAGEFDLSIGSVFGFAPMLAAVIMEMGFNVWLSVFISLMVCCLIGFTHGVITVKTHIPSFITTLGGMLIWRGVSLAVTGGIPKYFYVPEEFMELMVGRVAHFVYMQAVWFFVIVAIFMIILERHKFGNWIYATGGKKEAARAMGINTDKVKITCFILCSLTAGLGGIAQSTRVGSALPNQGDGLEFDAIAAAVIGGTSLFGGSGTVVGTVIGEYLSRIIENGLIIIRAPSYYFRLYIGVVIILAVIANLYIQRRTMKIRG
jgi:simple sugar transport system permease protein